MQTVYKIVGGSGGRCSCGHLQRKGQCYYLLDTNSRTHTLCQHCGQEQGLNEWWGTKAEITVEEMQKMWFGAEPIKEVVCRHLSKYTRRSGNSTKREEMLRVAVEV